MMKKKIKLQMLNSKNIFETGLVSVDRDEVDNVTFDEKGRQVIKKRVKGDRLWDLKWYTIKELEKLGYTVE